MQPIGSFTKAENGFTGTVKTVAYSLKVRVVENEGASEQAPDYRIYSGNAECGAGWKRRSDAGRDFISLKLDDPSFSNPLYASLFPTDDPDTYTLLWSRPKSDR